MVHSNILNSFGYFVKTHLGIYAFATPRAWRGAATGP